MTIEEKLRDTMRAHDTEAPTHVPWPAADAAVVHRRPSTRFVLAAALVAVLVAGGAWAVVAWPRSAAHTPPAAEQLSCPAERDSFAETADVPSPATVPGAADRLVPAAVPDAVLVCGYVAPGTPAGHSVQVPLSGSVELTGDLGAVSAALSPLRADDGTTTSCGRQDPGTIDDGYLLGLTYPDGIVWVSAPGDACLGTSNGAFLTPTNMAATVARWLADGRAGPPPADPAMPTYPTPSDAVPTGSTPTGPTSTDPTATESPTPDPTTPGPGTSQSGVDPSAGCGTVTGRPDAADAMVPGTPTSLTICPLSAGASRTVVVTGGQLEAIVSELDALAASPLIPTNGGIDCAGAFLYQLEFAYGSGSTLGVTVSDCTPGVSNGTLQAGTTDDLVQLLYQATH